MPWSVSNVSLLYILSGVLTFLNVGYNIHNYKYNAECIIIHKHRNRIEQGMHGSGIWDLSLSKELQLKLKTIFISWGKYLVLVTLNLDI